VGALFATLEQEVVLVELLALLLSFGLVEEGEEAGQVLQELELALPPEPLLLGSSLVALMVLLAVHVEGPLEEEVLAS